LGDILKNVVFETLNYDYYHSWQLRKRLEERPRANGALTEMKKKAQIKDNISVAAV